MTDCQGQVVFTLIYNSGGCGGSGGEDGGSRGGGTEGVSSRAEVDGRGGDGDESDSSSCYSPK